MKKSRVFVDGALIGLDDDAKALVASIRSMRRQGAISSEVNVSHKEYNGDVVILTDRGRARRPLIVLKNGCTAHHQRGSCKTGKKRGRYELVCPAGAD